MYDYNNYKTADEMRIITKENMVSAEKLQMDEIMEKILAAARDGKFEIYYDKNLYYGVDMLLKKLDYKIRWIENSSSSCHKYKISWES